MFGTQQRGVNAYAKVGLETGIGSASPHKLIVMLFDGALVAVLSAQMHMKSGNVPEKGKSISKAIQIIDNGLRASLDALYEYMSARLLTANLNNDLGMLEEVQRLLSDLRETWNAIGPTPAAAAAPGADLKRMPSLASA